MLMLQDSQSFDFLTLNIILISVVVLVIFGYLVMLIRKRWKKNFLHDAEDNRAAKK